MITEIEDFFAKGCGRCPRFATPDCSTRHWAPGLAVLRRLCLAAGLEERVKWGHPCYMHARRNIALIGAFRGDFRLTFFNAALMKDPERVLEPSGPNSRHPDLIRFTENGEPDARAAIIAAYLKEAMSYAEAGLKPPRDTSTPDLPEDLLEALDADPALAEAFQALTPGRQKSYVIALASAKRPETRRARILSWRERIIAGKGAQER
ncbi:YdeI/OmpD-associated family protein [Frigidibacter sp. SD6-1]|uniref:YdeI/OmpD-associated family protein n=1 Tax=Frigidibacter sp. SD6-1 TaxID=3032581 RepID=UPI0024DF80F2|nr:YdeI/OmpD-associated family protein [Frigidibacter sp. SD6-1]